MLTRFLAGLGLLFVLSGPALALDTHTNSDGVPVEGREDSPGGILYKQRCATCHDNPTGRIPARTHLGVIKTPEGIIAALSTLVRSLVASRSSSLTCGISER